MKIKNKIEGNLRMERNCFANESSKLIKQTKLQETKEIINK